MFQLTKLRVFPRAQKEMQKLMQLDHMKIISIVFLKSALQPGQKLWQLEGSSGRPVYWCSSNEAAEGLCNDQHNQICLTFQRWPNFQGTVACPSLDNWENWGCEFKQGGVSSPPSLSFSRYHLLQRLPCFSSRFKLKWSPPKVSLSATDRVLNNKDQYARRHPRLHEPKHFNN